MISRKFSRSLQALISSAFVLGAVVLVPTQAQAAEVTPESISCQATQEVCRDIHTNWQGGTVANLRTVTSNVSGGTLRSYEVIKGNPYTGTVVCSGQMGYNATKTCNVGSYSGQLTFTFYKGQNTLTTLSMTGDW